MLHDIYTFVSERDNFQLVITLHIDNLLTDFNPKTTSAVGGGDWTNSNIFVSREFSSLHIH